MTNDFDQLPQEIDLSPKPKQNKRLLIVIVCVLLVVILAVCSALLVKVYVVTSYIVHNVSMYPTLDGGSGPVNDTDESNGEVLYLNKLAKIRRGDIVVFKHNNSYLVKRVIAVGGDTIEIKDQQVFLNGKALQEPYAQPMDNSYDGFCLQIQDGKVFCMGDNRNNSNDSRDFGPIPLDDVVGRCFLIKGLDGDLRKP